MQIRHRSAYYDAFFTEALLSFVETGLASADQAGASRGAITEMVRFLPHHQPRGGARGGRLGRSASSPRWRRCRIRAFRGFSRRSSRTSASASTCRIATPRHARSRRQPRPAPTDPILDQPLLDFYAGYQVRGGANAPKVTVPLNDNIDYEGGVVTWIDNLEGERPFGNDLDPTLNLDILEVSFRNLKPLEDHRDAAAARHRPPHRRLPEAARRHRRVHRSALAHLLSAGTVLRLFRPLLRRLPRAAAGGAANDRSRRRVRFHPRPGAGLSADRVDRRAR